MVSLIIFVYKNMKMLWRNKSIERNPVGWGSLHAVEDNQKKKSKESMDEHVSGGQEGWAHETQCEVIGSV